MTGKLALICSLLVVVAGCQQEGAPAGPPLPVEELEAGAALPDKPMLPAHKLPGDLRPYKADQYSDYKDANPATYGITNPPSVPFRPVAEYEPAARLMITASATSLPAGIKKNLADIVKYGKDVATVYVIYDSSAIKSDFSSTLQTNGVSPEAVTWLNITNDSAWTRDYGPLPIISTSGKVGMVDLRYYHQRIYDDAIPTKLGSLWNVSVYRAPIDFEGGNFMSDTKGNCFASQGLLWYNSVSETQVKKYMTDYVGCTTTTIMKALANEGTTHIDMQMKLVDDKTVIVGEYGQTQDSANYAITNQNASTFQAMGYNVVRMPMPSNSDGNFRTYINSLFVNGINLVPVYSVDKAKETQALAIWKQVMPTWQHVPLNSDTVITWAGATHCITMTTGAGSFSPMESAPGYACNGAWDCYPGSTNPGGCNGISFQGCCDGNLLQYCEDDQLKQVNCGNNPQCGWDSTNKYYNCGTAGAADPSGVYPKSCPGSCTPNCTGKQCGSDGCGGSCGTCGAGTTCTNGQCVPVCTPNCTGKQCGDNGCGGSCGTCGAGTTCTNGQCVAVCTPSCAGKVCGDDGCGGSCGNCPAGQICQFGKCQVVADPCLGVGWEGCCDGTVLHWCEGMALQTLACGSSGCGWNKTQSYYDCNQSGADPSGKYPLACPGGQCLPNCAGKSCGDDGCGGSCGTCAANQTCQNGACVGAGGCGNVTYAGYCEGNVLVWCENNQLYQADCSKLVGNFKCEWHEEGAGFYCVEQSGPCQPVCTGKQCGDDGCGGSCGVCPAGQLCEGGQCKPGACVPACGGKECGDDGCGGSCGSCAVGKKCKAGLCVAECTPDCAGLECGSDGCNGSCGSCPAGFSCQQGKCVAGCVGDCQGKECGDDGCGGLCGSCAEGELCVNGQCVTECQPACAGKDCGPDGCGGDCGACPKGFTCDQGSCVADRGGCGNVPAVGLCEADVLKRCVAGEVVVIDCGATGKVCSFVPSVGLFDCVDDCISNCLGKECGDDGCGGECGSCSKGFACDAGKCVEQIEPCTPVCTGKQCGDDGCGGSCGQCADGQECAGGLCQVAAGDGDVIVGDGEPEEQEDVGGGGEKQVKSGGCSAGATQGNSATGVLALAALLLGLALVVRRRTAGC